MPNEYERLIELARTIDAHRIEHNINPTYTDLRPQRITIASHVHPGVSGGWVGEVYCPLGRSYQVELHNLFAMAALLGREHYAGEVETVKAPEPEPAPVEVARTAQRLLTSSNPEQFARDLRGMIGAGWSLAPGSLTIQSVVQWRDGCQVQEHYCYAVVTRRVE